MTRTKLLRSWFIEPPLSGKLAALWILLSLPLAMLIRSTMDCPDAIGECCTPLIILVMLTAVLLGSVGAGAVAVLAAVASLLVSSNQGTHGQMAMATEGGEVWGMALYVLYCVAVIAAVELTRRTFARHSRYSSPNESSSGIIFSVEQGQAWASWPGNPLPVRLGPAPEVTTMMQDFILQAELAHRLAQYSKSGSGETACACDADRSPG